MRNTYALEERRRALEEEYFRERDAKLLETLRRRMRADHEREALRAVASTGDPAVLDELVRLGIQPATLAAFLLAPLVEVAWANGAVDAAERRTILRDAGVAALPPNSAAHEIFDAWLEERPPPAFLDAWVAYTRAVSERLPGASRQKLREAMVQRVLAVARAAGGVLGVGRVSLDEIGVIERVEAAFGPRV